jgi:hypothetical protein
MIDPQIRLAFSIANAPGATAVLLGAGVSRAAGIPSGWEVLVTLVQRLAVAEKVDTPTQGEAEAWFERHTGHKPTYSNVLQTIAPTSAQRHALLAAFFEPTEDEPRMPTATHHAVARLAAAGLVRVILTTNFDRLMEQALEAAGVVPRVVASAAQVAGMTPLAHARCTVVKLHGDYVLGDLRNSDEEIGAYPPEINTLLDRTLDDYGLFVIGWSGTWDHALRFAIERSPTRRYSQTWLAVGGVSDVSKALIAHRGMDIISAASADAVVPAVADTAMALHISQVPSSDTEAAWVERQKRYLRLGSAGDMDHQMMLYDARDRLRAATLRTPVSFAARESAAQWGEVRKYAEAIEQHSAPLCSLALRAALFGTSEIHRVVVDIIAQLTAIERGNGMQALLDLRSYPAVLVCYAFAVGAFLRRNGSLLRDLWSTIPDRGRRDNQALLYLASLHAIRRSTFQEAFLAPNGGKWKAPVSKRIEQLLVPRLLPITGTEEDAVLAIARTEYLWALSMAVKAYSPENDGSDGFHGLHLYTEGAGEDFGNQVRNGSEPWGWVLPSGCIMTTSEATLHEVLPLFTRENQRQSF